MNEEQFYKFEQFLIQKTDEFLTVPGNQVIDGKFRIDSTSLDPIGIATAHLYQPIERGYDLLLCDALGFDVTQTEMWSFIDGFDRNGSGGIIGKNSRWMYDLGISLRNKYLP